MMQLARAVLIIPLFTAVNALGAISASWRVNPISPEAIAGSPSLGNAVSLSLLLETTAGSQWDSTGIAFQLAPGLSFYNQVPFGTDGPPNPALLVVFPELQFDSYIVGTPRGQYLPGAPSIPPDRGINLLWGPPPQIGFGEIARFTVLNATIGSSDPFAIGEIREINPLANSVPLPMPPIAGVLPIPEPTAVAIILLALPRRRRRI